MALNDGRAKVYLRTLNSAWGGFISQWGWEFNGLPHVLPRTNTELTNIRFKVGNTDIKKPIWMFGDSHFNYWAGGFTYHFKQWGIQNFAIAARGGENSTGALEELKRMLNYGRPKYILWELGGNDHADYNTWLAVWNEVRSICEEYHITMIGVTYSIGKTYNTTSRSNLWAMGDYVKASGIRYVDIRKALGCNIDGEWYNNGQDNDFQSTDGIHISGYGGAYATHQFLVDFPEIMQYNNVEM
jgi:hypothetical protein